MEVFALRMVVAENVLHSPRVISVLFCPIATMPKWEELSPVVLRLISVQMLDVPMEANANEMVLARVPCYLRRKTALAQLRKLAFQENCVRLAQRKKQRK